jgi:hypothetical protein
VSVQLHRLYRFDNGTPFTTGGQKNALGIVDGLSQVRYRALPEFSRTREAVTDDADRLLERCANQFESGRIRVNDAMGFRIDNEDSRFDSVKKDLEIGLIAQGIRLPIPFVREVTHACSPYTSIGAGSWKVYICLPAETFCLYRGEELLVGLPACTPNTRRWKNDISFNGSGAFHSVWRNGGLTMS